MYTHTYTKTYVHIPMLDKLVQENSFSCINISCYVLRKDPMFKRQEKNHVFGAFERIFRRNIEAYVWANSSPHTVKLISPVGIFFSNRIKIFCYFQGMYANSTKFRQFFLYLYVLNKVGKVFSFFFLNTQLQWEQIVNFQQVKVFQQNNTQEQVAT